VGCFFAAVFLRFLGLPTGILARPGALWARAIVTAVVTQACLYYGELYEHGGLRRRIDLFLRLSGSFAFAILLLTTLFFALPGVEVGRGVLLIYVPLALGAILAWRVFFVWAWDNEALTERVLLLGTGTSAQGIAAEIRRRSPVGFRVVGFLGRADEVGGQLAGSAIVGSFDQLLDLTARRDVTLIVVADEDLRGRLPIDALLQCRLRGVRVEQVSSFYERLTGKILVRDLRPSALVFSDGFVRPKLLRSLKRLVELVLAGAMLALTAPLFAILGLVVRISSPGPVLYRQRRVGKRGREFELLKFRTMNEAAEASGPVWSVRGGDPRVTAVGRLLRLTRLDELPQLINVLRGEMSFVGPRPERPEFVERLTPVIPYYAERHTVFPGITGWAQINFPYGSTLEDAEEKLEYDLYYLKHMSLALDFVIVVKTLRVMVLGRGGR
jgi:sugar transferase (PEP-CTERM system associated)